MLGVTARGLTEPYRVAAVAVAVAVALSIWDEVELICRAHTSKTRRPILAFSHTATGEPAGGATFGAAAIVEACGSGSDVTNVRSPKD